MNSRQRRRKFREYRYNVCTEHDDYNGYIEAWEWLTKHYGPGQLQKKNNAGGWFEVFDVDDVILDNQARSPWYFKVRWHFKKSATAIEFALRWK